MLLVHQAGSVKVGEVVRYTLTYTPANDRILPTPQHLHVKVKNTSAIPLRAAWVHGPYTLHVSAYPATFNPYQKTEDPERDGMPQYEPLLKAAGSWQAKLLVPDDIRETGADLGKKRQSTQSGESTEKDEKGGVTWIIEVHSQILFSTSASVHFEVFVGRDERSLDLGFAAVAGHGHGGPGQVQSHTSDKERKRARLRGHLQTAGVYSKAVRLVVENTEALWDKPALPSWNDDSSGQRRSTDSKRQSEEGAKQSRKPRKKRKIHLVVLTHGMHSNTGADMLFLKESIDATAQQARIDAKKRREGHRAKERQTRAERSEAKQADKEGRGDTEDSATAPLTGGQEALDDTAYDSDDDEQTIVRGFPGNAVRTENGIQYLGKRLAKYILQFTYPDQPYLPVKKPLSRTLTDTFKSDATKAKRDGLPTHAGSSVKHEDTRNAEELPYTFTSISFIGHSLGGLTNTYAMAYIHKHNPDFFTQIKPVNFVCLASPMLGLSNENPMYVKFALDFGLVGRTGQDLGLTWRAPALAKGGWNAMIGGLGAGQKDQNKDEDPATKPILRILPTGPAHQVLRMFRNRTLYSNVVNDGIVPLRTSCLLFLDWRGLDKVEKARRENGLIGTVAEWGWAEITGQNQGTVRESSAQRDRDSSEDDTDADDTHVPPTDRETVPQPAEDETTLDNKRLTTRASYDETSAPLKESRKSTSSTMSSQKRPQQELGMWDNFLNFFRPNTPDRSTSPKPPSKKATQALRRGQTMSQQQEEAAEADKRRMSGTTSNPTMRPHLHDAPKGEVQSKRPGATRGDGLINNETGEFQAPPSTSVFEAAGDILHPPLPDWQWITDPSSRTRTIFHDRVYHPDDIPPPPVKRQGSRFGRSFASESTNSVNSQDMVDSSGMKVEEKIARAYHKDLSWRKVLVRLEPDAHNNMIVRRMFANAYGWPVVKHMCDTHFADTHAAKTRDEYEAARERAKPMDAPLPETGEEVLEQTALHVPKRTQSETREAQDELAKLSVPRDGASGSYSSKKSNFGSRESSGMWDDSFFEDGDGDDSDVDERNIVAKMLNPMPVKKPEQAYQRPGSSKSNGSPRTPTTPYTDGHRGLAPISPTSNKSLSSPKSGAPTSSEHANVDDPVIANRLVEEPQPIRSTSEVGLQKSVEEQMSPTKASGSLKSESGDSDGVARTDFTEH